MSDTSIIAIILSLSASLLAVGGTLIGIWLGRLLERNNETLKWRRDHCLEAYDEVLMACHRVITEADKVYLESECGTLEQVDQYKVIDEKVAEMDRAWIKTILLGSWIVHKSLDKLVKHCGEEIATKCKNCPKLSKDEWHKIWVTDFATVFAEFQIAARNDLEVFPKRYKFKGIKGYKTIEEIKEELLKGKINSKQARLRFQYLKMKLKKEWDKKDREARKNK